MIIELSEFKQRFSPHTLPSELESLVKFQNEMSQDYYASGFYLKPELDGAMLSTYSCLLYTSPSPRDKRQSRMPSSA